MTMLYLFYLWLISPVAMILSIIGLVVFPGVLIFPTIRNPYLEFASYTAMIFSFLVVIAHGLRGLGLAP